ncbi:HD-GYP domain-containing protein [Methylobacter tundripaludum]|uniref:Metal dependent phosphohydrolase n=1 Tax=Methylobacter tundripaludum (strain ATCC BAA-1195 / DSM 17260 / SV96) TaxID=697282 RepID=G3IZT3_METTV|nr:HD domain-containing phosphohydrolase [Methylobacter tundripaludum]EGW20455.1 metal dependent phosphohydrolase [Methylobacter tundripaludum SV96]
MQQQHVDIHNAITALSCALDLVGVDEVRHGKRVAIMARAIARHLNWSEVDCLSILYAGMLHDCGVSRVHEHHQLTETLEWDGAEDHCIRGADYLSACPPLAHLSAEIRYHHTRWEDLLASSVDHRLCLRTNLLYLADRIDMLQAPFLSTGHILTEYPAIIAQIKTLSGILFAPELVDAFAEIADVEAFWLAMEPEYLDEDLRSIGSHIPTTLLDIPALKELARLFSRVVDAKSPYTDEHSQRVAHIARQLAMDFGIKGYELEQVEIAGLLHDIGKLRVSEDIIDKPGSLTPEERATMHRHSYDTFRILQRVFDDSKIPLWAGFHHETLIGDGYPFKNGTKELDLECRIITVADIFQALAQERPYRHTMSLEYILDDLQSRVASGHLDAGVVAKLTENAALYYRLAVAG